MRPYFLLTLVLSGCGAAESASEAQPEVARINIADYSCPSATECGLAITATFNSGESHLDSPYTFVVSLIEGATLPTACDSSSLTNTNVALVQPTNLKSKTLYSFRGCVFNSKSGKYTTGITTTHTTAAAD